MTMHSNPTAVTHVTIRVGNDHAMTAMPNGGDGALEGSVFFNNITVQFAGTPDQLRRFAQAITDGADKIERELAAATPKRTPLGDRRERSVPCSVCRGETWNLAGRCDRHLVSEGVHLPGLASQ